MLVLIFILLVVWCVFFSKSYFVGKILYWCSILIETKIAKLTKYEISCADGSQYIFYSNQTSTKTSHATVPDLDPSKPSILMLHGFSADKNIWLKFAKYVKRDYQVIIPDFMGHGGHSYDPGQNYSANAQAQYINNLLKTLFPEKPTGLTVIGNSMGGMVAAILAQKSTLVSKLILLDPAGAKTDFAINLANKGINPFFHDNIETVHSFYNNSMHKPPFVPPAVFTYIAHDNYLSKRTQYKHMFEDFFDIDSFFTEPLSCDLTKFPSCIVVWGEKDALLPASDANYWQTVVNGEVIILAGIGHMPMVECPKSIRNLL